jgi:iron complex transport system substrate-binding protein
LLRKSVYGKHFVEKNVLGGDKEKMKTKIVVLVGITLFTMLLVSPALASDAGTLDIYGNANEDDTIDMRDLTYVKLIFFGKKPETELADAKYDGEINPLDFIQIKLIIVGKEKELTVVDGVDRIVTVKKPVERVIGGSAEAIKILKAEYKMVGVPNYIKDMKVFFPELSKLPSIGSSMASPDYEKIIELRPDIAIWLSSKPGSKSSGSELEKLGITVVYADLNNPTTIIEEIRKLGYILNKEDEANEFMDWYNGYMDAIKQRTDTLSEEDKPKVYAEFYGYTFTKGYALEPMISIAGGRNIAADLGENIAIIVDKEWVVEQNPDIIVGFGRVGYGYGVDDPTALKDVRDAILNRPEFAIVTAVKSESVYILPWGDLVLEPGNIIGIAYTAKWFHPELFKELDPEVIHQEYLDRFQRIDYDLDEHGVFVYPPIIKGKGKLAGIPDRYYDSIVAQP